MNRQIEKAQEDLYQAWQNFNHADEDYKEAAIIQLNICMDNLSNLLKKQKRV